MSEQNLVDAGVDSLETVEELPQPENTQALTAELVAREVVSGHWGRGNRRHEKLKAAGYDPAEVQKEVNKLLGR